MTKFKCKCIKEVKYFDSFSVGRFYEGVISEYETGVTILGPNKEQETYFSQGHFEAHFEII
jgi:hypothetical protein